MWADSSTGLLDRSTVSHRLRLLEANAARSIYNVDVFYVQMYLLLVYVHLYGCPCACMLMRVIERQREQDVDLRL